GPVKLAPPSVDTSTPMVSVAWPLVTGAAVNVV
ncbi:MAG: hypothetical protein JWL97_3753, partial [Gemmatimonadales bacterium]|nr:hypothetical protein [Gemmatimonadales bacterium]